MLLLVTVCCLAKALIFYSGHPDVCTAIIIIILTIIRIIRIIIRIIIIIIIIIIIKNNNNTAKIIFHSCHSLTYIANALPIKEETSNQILLLKYSYSIT